MKFFRKANDLQMNWLNTLDRLLPDKFQLDNNETFLHQFVTRYLAPGPGACDAGGDIKNVAGQLGLLTERLRLYYHSNYFAFVAPLYALWRVWTLAFYMIDREQAAELFP